MRTRNEVLDTMLDSGVIAVIRMTDTEKLSRVAEAISAGGVKCMEITMTTPDALEVIKTMRGTAGDDFLIGAGTVLDPETARLVILAGADFVVGPTLNLDVIRMAHRYDKVVVPGAYTPTEILTAWEAGADVVKVFPATSLGPGFFKDVGGPLPQVRLLPTGGVNVENAGEFIKNGAVAVAVGTALLDKKAIAESNWDRLTDLAANLVENVTAARVSR